MTGRKNVKEYRWRISLLLVIDFIVLVFLLLHITGLINFEDVLQALRQIIYEPGYKDNAVKISESFRSCGGAAEAGAFLEEIADGVIER